MTPWHALVREHKMYLWQLSKKKKSFQEAELISVVSDDCRLKAKGVCVHEVTAMSLCCACGVINLSGTCNSG